MTSPFYEAPGIHKYGDLKFEWRSLLNTPCYGFNGPNACYSTTCSHNPLLSESEKQLTKQKLSTSTSKLLLKLNYNGRKSMSSSEHAPDHITTKSSLASHLTVQMNVYNRYNAYNELEPKLYGGDFYYDNSTNRNQFVYNDSPEDIDRFVESSCYYMSRQSFESNFQTKSMHLSHEYVTKKYAFIPLSEPFHPKRSSSSSDTSFTSEELEVKTESSSQSSSQPSLPAKEFVCILCPEKFTTLDELKGHIKDKIRLPCACVICGMSYEHNYLLQRHLKIHRGSKTFNCRGCHKKFRTLNQLSKHFELCRYKLYIFL